MQNSAGWYQYVKMQPLNYITVDGKIKSLGGIFRNIKYPISGHHTTGMDSSRCSPILRAKDTPPEEAKRILRRLNSFGSAEELENATNKCTGKKVLSTGDARKILLVKSVLGEFLDLQQVACTPRIGAEKFDAIVRALSDKV